MAKIPNSVIGIDLGRYSYKSVVMHRRGGNKFQLSNYAVHPIDGPVETPDQIAAQVKHLLKEMGGSAKACVVAATSPDALIRIIEQPSTPREVLRDALKINGFTLLNQDVRDFVLDCAPIESGTIGGAQVAAPGVLPKVKYLVGGLPRKQVTELDDIFQKSYGTLNGIQISQVCIFNAFAQANEETFKNEAFLLVDIGHLASTVTVGLRKELIIVRTLEYGGKGLMDSLVRHGGGNAGSVLSLLEEGDDLLIETARLSLATLTREISSSIGFFEGRHEENISRIFVSGGPANSKAILRLLAEELHMPCEVWNPFAKCEMSLPGKQKAAITADLPNLNVACGAALEFLKSK
ncbi:MAG TPA: pilus assembly protein PilM [Chthoniobacteraceae bacterium]|nr:pilus assembly protein PilM [Chthoniobacteraceae bacterium]